MITGLRKVFYRLINFLSEHPLPADAGDFRLVDRRVVDEIKKIEDYQPYLRGTIAELGFNQKGIEYDRNERQFGKSKFSFSALFRLALDGVLNHSTVPLRISTFTGLIVSVITLFFSLFYFIAKLYWGDEWTPGFATTSILHLFHISINALFLGVIGEYLGRMYRQMKKIPITAIEHKANISLKDEK